MSLYDHFSMDKDAESSGVVIDYGSSGQVRIARAGGSNVRYNKRIQAFSKKYRRQIELEILEDATAEKELISIYVDTIVLGWEGVKDRAGIDIPFSPNAAAQLFRDLPEFFADIRDQSTKLAIFREMERDTDSGN